MKSGTREGLKIMSISLSLPAPNEPRAWRRDLGLRLVNEAAERGCDLLVLPAGYLRARSEAEVRNLADAVIAAAQPHVLAIVVGVDCVGAARKTPYTAPTKHAQSSGEWPFFVAAWAPHSPGVRAWQQRSTNSSDGWCVTVGAPRTLAVRGWTVEILLCGEIFSRPIRADVLRRRSEESVIVIPAHYAQGSRHWAGQAYFAGQRIPSLRSVHAKRGDQLKSELWLGDGSRSYLSPEYFGYGPLQAWVSVHHVPRAVSVGSE